MALFTLYELASYLQQDLDTATADLARSTATGIVEDVTGPLESRTSTVVLAIPSDGVITLPVGPVTDVTSVTVDGAAAAFVWLRPYPVISLTDWLPSSDPDVWPTATVEVVHGYGVVPVVAKAVALAVAGRAYANPRGLKSVRIDDYSEQQADDVVEVGLTAAEVTALERAFRRSATVTR